MDSNQAMWCIARPTGGTTSSPAAQDEVGQAQNQKGSACKLHDEMVRAVKAPTRMLRRAAANVWVFQQG